MLKSDYNYTLMINFQLLNFLGNSKGLGCVRLTQFRNKNTWSDDLKRYQDNEGMFKKCLTKNEGFLTSIPCIPIPEKGQSNAPLVWKGILQFNHVNETPQ